MTRLTKVPFHLEHIKGYTWVYNKELLSEHHDGFEFSVNISKDILLLARASTELSLATWANFNASNSERAIGHLHYLNYFGISGFKRLLLPKNETIEIQLHKYILDLSGEKGEKAKHSVSGASWSKYFWNAILLGKADDARYLSSILESDIFYWSNDAEKLFFHICCAFFKLNELDINQGIQELVNLTEDCSFELLDFSTSIMLPTISVLTKITSGEGEVAYQKVVHSAAMEHYKFWKQKRLEGKNVGNFSLPLSALARFAFNKFGYELGFECDYIPEYFIKGDFPDISFEPFEPLPE